MKTIEKMAEALKNKVRESQGRLEYVIKLLDQADVIITTYESEKSLLEKTADWHEHGTVAPSCVGCPTAKAMIEGDWIMVRRERLIATLRNKKIHVHKKVNYFPGVEHVKTISTIEEQLAHLTEGSNDG